MSDDPYTCTVGDLLKFYKGEPNDGPQALTINAVSGGGSKTVRLHVSNAAGESTEIPIGVPGDRRLSKHLRMLLGSSELETVEEICQALTGKTITVRLTTIRFAGNKTMRGIERAR